MTAARVVVFKVRTRGSLEDALEVSVVQEDAGEELVARHFQNVVGVANAGNFGVGQTGDGESGVQESVGVGVDEDFDVTIAHQDVARTLVNGEPVTGVLQVESVAGRTGRGCTTGGRRLATLTRLLCGQRNARADQVQVLCTVVPESRTVVESFGQQRAGRDVFDTVGGAQGGTEGARRVVRNGGGHDGFVDVAGGCTADESDVAAADAATLQNVDAQRAGRSGQPLESAGGRGGQDRRRNRGVGVGADHAADQVPAGGVVGVVTVGQEVARDQLGSLVGQRVGAGKGGAATGSRDALPIGSTANAGAQASKRGTVFVVGRVFTVQVVQLFRTLQRVGRVQRLVHVGIANVDQVGNPAVGVHASVATEIAGTAAERAAGAADAVLVQADADVLQVGLALSRAGGFTCTGDGRQQQCSQQGDDGDHHQQFDQGET